jgi:formylglycine-generating enzyme required for sulfatase activity
MEQMVVMPAGGFWMGADDEQDKFASLLEKPRHRVQFKNSFAIARWPVTFQQWDQYCDANLDAHRPCDSGWGRGRKPVINVSWNDATAYVKWLSQTGDRKFRLPTEAEWEYCCRAGTSSVFATGNSISITQANFLYLDFGDKPGVGKPVDVGSYPPNEFGLYDMHGNVCELVSDVWHDTFAGAPSDGSSWNEPSPSPWRVVRGGGWDGLPRVLRSAFRDWVRRDQRMDNMGFRIACDVK